MSHIGQKLSINWYGMLFYLIKIYIYNLILIKLNKKNLKWIFKSAWSHIGQIIFDLHAILKYTCASLK